MFICITSKCNAVKLYHECSLLIYCKGPVLNLCLLKSLFKNNVLVSFRLPPSCTSMQNKLFKIMKNTSKKICFSYLHKKAFK